MGVVIDVRDHSLSTEKGRVEELRGNVDGDVSKINDSLNALGNYWKDSNSEKMISSLIESMNQIKAANIKAKAQADQYLGEVGSILKPY